jgi:hypothetical protein
MESVPIAIMTLYETNEIQKELRKLTAIGPHRSTRWVYDFNKQGILDDDWAITFNGILRDIIGSNPGKIKIGATSAKQITDALDHNDLERLLEINPEIGYGNRNFSFKSFFIPWLSFKSTESGLKTTFGEDLKEILKENLGILTVELKTSFEVLKKAYLQLKEHDSFKEEIENAVLDAIKIFMDISWENPKEVKAMVIEGNKKTFFKINTFLNMNLLPKINLENPDNLYNINDEKTQGRLINWLKSRLFVITVYELIKNPKYSDVIKRNHFSEEQKNRPFDLAILAGLRNDMTHYNTHLIRDSRKATVKQLFYFLQLQGLLGCKGAEKDYLENSCLMEDEIQFLAQDLNNIFFEIPKTDF